MDVIAFLLKNNLTISCAESCTGGLLSARFVAHSGISKIFHEGIIAYSNSAKINRLGVDKKTLENFGAVSSQTSLEMLKNFKTDVAISTTGFAEANPDDLNQPAGLVYIGLKIKNNYFVKKFNFTGSRLEIQRQAVDSALDFLSSKLIDL